MLSYFSHFIVISSAFFFFSCDTARKANNIEQVEQIEEDKTEEVKPERGVFATIQKTYCYGKCPVYKMTIYEDGRTILEGKANLEMLGIWELKLEMSELESFTEMATKIGYMELEDKYDSAITDIPSTTTSIIIDGVRKEVYRRANYPEKILKFEALFTDLLEGKEWKKIGELPN